MLKKAFRLTVFVFFAYLLLSTWNPFWREDLHKAVSPLSTEKIVFQIEKDESASQIGERLEAESLVVSGNSFVRAVSDRGLENNLRSGSFVLSPNMTTEEIMLILSSEGGGTLAFTIPEGYTIQKIDAKLTANGLIEAGDFIRCAQVCPLKNRPDTLSLEGYLFPDTYFLDESSFDTKIFIQTLLDNFTRRFDNDMQIALEKSGRSLHDVVLVASLLEREVRTPVEFAHVADIIWRRLDSGWFLGIDATLLYNDEDGVLTRDDLSDENNPYNTRLIKGLPPTAIGNPGLASLKAALNPTQNTDWFYLTDSDGAVHYAKTNDEHNLNRARYLEIEN